jgi:hypothetical protein
VTGEDKMLPCPFCGHEAEPRYWPSGPALGAQSCVGCGAKGPTAQGATNAARQWQRRITPAPPPGEAEAIAREIERLTWAVPRKRLFPLAARVRALAAQPAAVPRCDRQVYTTPDGGGSHACGEPATVHRCAVHARDIGADLAALREKAAAYDALVALLDIMRHPGEGSNDFFERCAAVYHRETGYLAPGKDTRLDEGTPAERRERYEAWCNRRVAAALAAARDKEAP